jgi:hypothetical protein
MSAEAILRHIDSRERFYEDIRRRLTDIVPGKCPVPDCPFLHTLGSTELEEHRTTKMVQAWIALDVDVMMVGKNFEHWAIGQTTRDGRRLVSMAADPKTELFSALRHWAVYSEPREPQALWNFVFAVDMTDPIIDEIRILRDVRQNVIRPTAGVNSKWVPLTNWLDYPVHLGHTVPNITPEMVTYVRESIRKINDILGGRLGIQPARTSPAADYPATVDTAAGLTSDDTAAGLTSDDTAAGLTSDDTASTDPDPTTYRLSTKTP